MGQLAIIGGSRGRGGGSGGSNTIYVGDEYIFADATERDAYFVINPAKLVENLCVITGGMLQQWRGGMWVNVTVVFKGEAGLSAYEVWLAEGNTGSEQDFLDSLKGTNGEGVPAGGTNGQVLAKKSATDYDAEWKDAQTVGGATPNDGKLTIKKDADDPGKTFTANQSGDTEVNLGLGAVAFKDKIDYGSEIENLPMPPNVASEIATHNSSPTAHSAEFAKKVDKAQGSANAGKYLGIDISGNVAPMAVSQAATVTDGETITGDGSSSSPLAVSSTTKAALALANSALQADDLTAHNTDAAGNQHPAIRKLITDLAFLADASYNDQTGDVVITRRDNSTVSFNIFVENLVKDMDYDDTTHELVIQKASGTEIRINIADLVDTYMGSTGDEIQIIIGSGNEIQAILRSGAVKKSHLEQAVQTSLGKADSAYQKPATGIPSTDMESSVQQALTKAGTALQTEIDPVYLADKPSIALKTDVSSAVNTHNNDNTSHSDLRQAIADAEAIARGKSRAKVFATEADLDLWLSVPANVATLQIGDNFYIEATDVPDYWWNGTARRPIESEKVDLTDCYSKSEADGKFVVKVIGKGLSDENYTLTEKNKLAGIDISNYYTKSQSDNQFVAHVAGKGLSEKDFTAAFETLMTFYTATPPTVTTLTNIPTTAKLVYANLSAAQSLSVSGTPPVGQTVHVCARNTAASAISVSIPTTGSYISKDASVSIPASGFWEFSIIYDTVVSRYRIINLGLS